MLVEVNLAVVLPSLPFDQTTALADAVESVPFQLVRFFLKSWAVIGRGRSVTTETPHTLPINLKTPDNVSWEFMDFLSSSLKLKMPGSTWTP